MTIAGQLQQIQQLISKSAESCQRSAAEIHLLAVSKGQPSSAIREAFAAGITSFGESYLQEALAKIQTLADLPINWHFIGPIQSNKTQGIAQNFNWVHSVSREKIAHDLAKYRPNHLPPLNICLQVNLDDEETKSGVSAAEIVKLALNLSQVPSLQLRGLMAIPKPLINEQEQYESLERLPKLLKQLNAELHLSMDTLSMGMSHDLVAAIRAGATILRIGTAIFGERLRT
ncbi:MAG: YggS family pyridoxal phosphate-dependent enzyme [Tatlockia sp.]|nr:YggS family pyridoxal phosphate-dependent enzyme [Tatlockia sp.]